MDLWGVDGGFAMDLNILTMDLRWICLFDTFFAWCEACAQKFLHTVGNLQFPLSSPWVPAPKDLVAGPMYEALFLLVVVTVTGTNRFFDIVKSRQQKESGTTSTTPISPEFNPSNCCDIQQIMQHRQCKAKTAGKSKKTTFGFRNAPVPKRVPNRSKLPALSCLQSGFANFHGFDLMSKGVYTAFFVSSIETMYGSGELGGPSMC